MIEFRINQLYTGRLFHSYMLGEYVLGVSGLFCLLVSIFDEKYC